MLGINDVYTIFNNKQYIYTCINTYMYTQIYTYIHTHKQNFKPEEAQGKASQSSGLVHTLPMYIRIYVHVCSVPVLQL